MICAMAKAPVAVMRLLLKSNSYICWTLNTSCNCVIAPSSMPILGMISCLKFDTVFLSNDFIAYVCN